MVEELIDLVGETDALPQYARTQYGKPNAQ